MISKQYAALKRSWRQVAAKPKAVLFQLAACGTGAVLMALVVPIFIRVVIPTREYEVGRRHVEYAGKIDDTYNVQSWIPDKDRSLTFTEKGMVRSFPSPTI
jgi:hypothetical protein